MPPAFDASDESRLEKLRQELAAPLPHPGPLEMRHLASLTTDSVLDDFITLPERSVGRSASRAEMEALLREPVPEEGRPFNEVLAEFQGKVAPYVLRPSHPRFLAFIPGAPTFLSILGDWLSIGTNYFDGVWLEAAGPAEVEIIVLDWLKELLGYPPQARGILTGGGSEATLTALVVARQRLDYADRSRAVLYEPDQRHWSADRAAMVVGLRPDQVERLPTQADGRLDPAVLVQAVSRDRGAGRLPWALVANAGSTGTGAIDPLAALADVCREQSLWLHADAAYGWSAALIPPGKVLLAGIDRADSITLDPHKWFAQSYDAGCLLVRDGCRLSETFALRPDYMQDVVPALGEISFCDHGLALTRRFRALKLWLTMKVLGVSWFRALVHRCCRLADLAEMLLNRSGSFTILSPPQLGILCFRFVPPGCRLSEEELDRLNLAIVEEVRASGRAFLSSTRLQGRVALRFCFVNWRTTAADVEEVVNLLEECGAAITSTLPA
jgi:glutamate/tyrosine decarboxylase-like PLP-dependent enzyme